MTIDTTALKCFIATAETLSFTKAAKRVNKTQSAVSQQNAKLENILGKTLFKRKKVLELTSDGEIFLNYAKQLFALHCEVIERFKEPEIKGEVRFGIPDDFASAFLYDILSEFRLLHPNILLHIDCDLTLNLYENFKKGKLDLVLLKIPCPKEEKYSAKISKQRLCWIGNEKLITKQKIIPLAFSPKPCVYRRAGIEALNNEKVKWRISFSSHSYTGIISAVRAGIGISILPEKMVPKDISIIYNQKLPKLSDFRISLVKSDDKNQAINSFEKFAIKYLS